jgi:hypothetical protein
LTLSRISYKAYNLLTFSLHSTHQNYSWGCPRQKGLP